MSAPLPSFLLSCPSDRDREPSASPPTSLRISVWHVRDAGGTVPHPQAEAAAVAVDSVAGVGVAEGVGFPYTWALDAGG